MVAAALIASPPMLAVAAHLPALPISMSGSTPTEDVDPPRTPLPQQPQRHDETTAFLFHLHAIEHHALRVVTPKFMVIPRGQGGVEVDVGELLKNKNR